LGVVLRDAQEEGFGNEDGAERMDFGRLGGLNGLPKVRINLLRPGSLRHWLAQSILQVDGPFVTEIDGHWRWHLAAIGPDHERH
jgi:hypothetical protein